MQLRYQASGRAGYEIIVQDHDSLEHIREFGVLCLPEGRSFTDDTGSCEAVLHVIAGSCSLRLGEQPFADLESRALPFAGPPTAVYLPAHTAYTIDGHDVEIAITRAAAGPGGQPLVIRSDDLSPNLVGQDNWERTVTMILPPDSPTDKLILGETINPPGNWSGVPTHKHDSDRPGVESVHEELYYFRVDRPGGWGIERIYDKAGLEQVLLLQDRVVTIMPRGYHTVSAAPGFTLYYSFVLAGPAKPLLPSLDPDQAWIAI